MRLQMLQMFQMSFLHGLLVITGRVDMSLWLSILQFPDAFE